MFSRNISGSLINAITKILIIMWNFKHSFKVQCSYYSQLFMICFATYVKSLRHTDVIAAVEGSMHDHIILIAANGNGSTSRVKCNNIIVSSIL